MSVEIRPYRGSPREYLDAVQVAFGDRFVDDDLDVIEPLLELERNLAAYDGDRVVGTATAFSFSVTVPGGELPAAGVTMVGVHPTHRRRGVLRRIMQTQLDDVHARAEPLAVLWASEGAIYQRFGYGLATYACRFEIERGRTAYRDPLTPAGQVRIVERSEAETVFPSIYERFRPSCPGAYTRSPAYWQAEFFHDPERWRRGAGPAFLVLHEGPEGPDGYARYRVKRDWDDGGPKSSLRVDEVIGLSVGVERELWRFLFDVDLMATIEGWPLPIDTPLFLWLAEPRRLRMSVADGMWLRIVDVAAALEGRRYRAEDALTLELDDPLLGWNPGGWRLEGGPDGARAVRSDADPDLAVSVGDLASLYLGTTSATRLLAAGRLEERRQGAALRADLLFGTGAAPWCPRVF